MIFFKFINIIQIIPIIPIIDNIIKMPSYIENPNTVHEVITRFKICAFFIFKGRKNKASKKYRRYLRMCYTLKRKVEVEKAKQLADNYLLSLRSR